MDEDIWSQLQSGWMARGNRAGGPAMNWPGSPAEQLAGLFGGFPGRMVPATPVPTPTPTSTPVPPSPVPTPQVITPGIGYGIPMPTQYEDMSYGAPVADPIALLFAAWMNSRYPSPY